ncbi:unnamed protein product [Leuciscus chuanchicus]
MELYTESVDYLKSHGISPVSEDEIVDSDLLQDVFPEETEWVSHSPLQTDPCLPSTPTADSPDDLLQKRMVVLKGVLTSEEIYLTELETLLTPMRALRAAAGTSQPVLSTEQVQTVFYQVPELRDLHKDFYTSLRTRLQPDKVMDQQAQQDQGREEGPDLQLYQAEHYLSVGDLFLKFVNQLGVYRGFIDNYENAVEIVLKCMQSDQRFRTLAESMMSSKGSDHVKTKYTFEALLYKPLDRVMKTTLVLHDLWKHTPLDHPDSVTLQEALRLTSSFLSGVNERSQCKRAVMLSRGERRQLLRDGFVVDVCESGHNLRHLFLYADMLLCAKLTSAGRQAQYRFCWYLPLVGLKLHWAAEHLPSTDYQMKIIKTRAKMYQLKQALQQHMGSGPAAAEARRRSQTWGSQMDLSVDVETGSALSQHPSDRSSASHQGVEARAAVSSPPMEAPILQLSSSEELDVVSIEAESEDSPPQSHAFEELLDVVTRAVHRLSIEWPEDRQDVRSKSKLDERFLPSRTQPQRRSLPFFPDLHTEVSKSWGKPVSYRVYAPQTSHYSSIQKYKEYGYGEMPKVEETLASYLSPATASSLKAPSLPSKPVKFTSSLVHKSYAAAGQAAACLHTMSIMQAYQAELLGDLEEGGGIGPDTVAELRRATDLSLRATKETAKSIGRSMAALVATERHLWLNLSDIKEKEKHVLLDAPVSTVGLFGDAVNSAVAKSQEAAKQAAALQKLLPRRSFFEAAEREQPHSSKKSAEHRATQKQSVSSRAPPQKSRGHGGRSQTQQSSRGDRSANPATSGVTGRSGLRRAHISRSTRKRSGLGMPAPSEEGAGAVCLVVPCRCAVTGRRTDYSTAGEKYGAVSLRCPQGTVLPTLPPPVLQGAAVSGEHISQGPPGNVVASGCPPPLRRVLEQSVWSFPAGAPLQGDEPTTQQQQNPETSLERLVPLVESLTAWKLLSNVSRWVLQTVEKGY